MRESVSYQAILEEGSLQEARRMLIRAGMRRLGPIPTAKEHQIATIDRVDVLETLLDRVFDVESWEDLLIDTKQTA